MGGELSLDSTPGQGTTFSFELPMATADEKAVPLDLTGRKALVVDDDPDILDFFELLLSDWGIEVTRVAGVAQARKQVAQDEYDLLLTDFHLEDGTGADIMQVLRAAQPHCRSILCSGAGLSARDRREARGLADEVLGKPIQPERLKVVVERVLGREI